MLPPLRQYSSSQCVAQDTVYWPGEAVTARQRLFATSGHECYPDGFIRERVRRPKGPSVSCAYAGSRPRAGGRTRAGE